MVTEKTLSQDTEQANWTRQAEQEHRGSELAGSLAYAWQHRPRQTVQEFTNTRSKLCDHDVTRVFMAGHGYCDRAAAAT